MFWLTDRVNIHDPPFKEVSRISCCIIGFDPPVDLINYWTICFEALIDVLGGGGTCPDRRDTSIEARVNVACWTDLLTDDCKGNYDAPLDGVGRRSYCRSGGGSTRWGSICPEHPGASADALATTVGGQRGCVGGRRTPVGGQRGCVGGRRTPLEVGPNTDGCCCSSDSDAFKEEAGSAGCAGAALEVGWPSDCAAAVDDLVASTFSVLLLL